MSLKHLASGSSCPPLAKGNLRLYSMKYCPYAQRTRLVLAAKKIPHDIVNINLVDKPHWFMEKTPLGKVPLLELQDGSVIYESLIVDDYLDEKYSEVPLYPKDPYKKAKDRILIGDFDKITPLFISLKSQDILTVQASFDGIVKILNNFEEELKKRETKYFSGSQPGMVDFTIWPWAERLELFKYKDAQYVLPEEQLPHLLLWIQRMKENDAVRESYLSPDKHFAFLQTFLSGSVNYDIDN